MVGSPDFVQKEAEKSTFSHTCIMLSQYLKEKGSFGDLSLGMTCSTEPNGNGISSPPTTTMDLFPMSEKQERADSRPNFTSMDLFPQQAGFAHGDMQKNVDSSVNRPSSVEPQSAQMTIFYAGQVIVFNDFPADKAKEVMLLASKGSSQNLPGFPSALAKTHPAVFAPNTATPKTPVEPSASIPPSSIAVPSFTNNLIREGIQPSTPAIASDLPIARKASLHRFLEKRKDRITAKAPYRMSGSSAASSKPAESKSWLGLAAQPSQ